MRKFFSMTFFIAIIFSITITAYAHGGSLDEYGGHVDHKTHIYHWHHGWPAHYHQGDYCEYNWIDRTDEGYIGYISQEEYDRQHQHDYSDRDQYVPDGQYPLVTPAPSSNLSAYINSITSQQNKMENNEETHSVFTDLFSFFFVWFMVYLILMCIRFFGSFNYDLKIMDVNKQLDFKHPHTKTTVAISLILSAIFIFELKVYSFFFFIAICLPIYLDQKEYKKIKTHIEAERKLKFEEEKQHYTEMYGGKDILDIINAPPTAFIDSDGYPHLSVGNDDIFVVYVAPKQPRVFHRNRKCGKNLVKRNYIDISSSLNPCKKCKPTIPDTKWYDEYRKIKAIKDKYKIE